MLKFVLFHLYMVDWLSRDNNVKNKDKKITGMNVNVNAISRAVDTSIVDKQVANSQDADLQRLKSCKMQGQQHSEDKVEHSIQMYSPIRHKLAMTDHMNDHDKQ